MNNYYSQLPDNYGQIYQIDAKRAKTAVLFTLACFVIFIIVCIVGVIPVLPRFNQNMGQDYLLDMIVPAVILGSFGYLLYIVLHELLHGIAYKALTKHKLTFGFTLTVAYCGVPDLYVSRKTALIALMMPFVVFSVLFIPLTVVAGIFFHVSYYFAILFILAGHLSGCCGDLYCMGLLLFRFKDERLLMNDTGPKQTFYLPTAEGND